MATIVKYKITTDFPEDDTFQVTKHRQTIMTVSTTRDEDDNGNEISARRTPDIKTSSEVKEGISAIGAVSGQPAQVIILETSDGLTKEGEKLNQSNRLKPAPLGHKLGD